MSHENIIFFKFCFFILLLVGIIGWMFLMAEYLKIDEISKPVSFKKFLKRSILLGPAYPIFYFFLFLIEFFSFFVADIIMPQFLRARQFLINWISK